MTTSEKSDAFADRVYVGLTVRLHHWHGDPHDAAEAVADVLRAAFPETLLGTDVEVELDEHTGPCPA